MPKLHDSTYISKQCCICSQPIRKGDKMNLHHTPMLRSRGGDVVAEVHEKCHRQHHRANGDFAYFGRIGGQISALDKHWAFYLKGVKDDPLYNLARDFYRMNYA